MKKALAYLTILLITLGSCGKRVLDKEITISGIVNDYSADRNDVVLIKYYLGADKSERVHLTLDSNGSFSHTYKAYMKGDVRVQSNNNKVNFQIIAHPGDRINISFENEKSNFWESLNFTGDRSVENRQITSFQHYFRENQVNHSIIKKASQELEFTEFKYFMDSVKEVSLKIHQEYISKERVSREVENWTLWNTYEPYFYNLYWHTIEHKDIKGENPFNFFNELLPLTEESLSATYTLNLFVSEYIMGYLNVENQKSFEEFKNKYTREDLTDNEKAKILSEYKQRDILSVISKSKGDLIKEIALARKLSSLIKNKEIDLFETNIELLENEITLEGIKQPLLNQYNETKQLIEHPLTQNEILKNIEGQSIYNVLDTIFTDSKGQVIVFDFWGPYCSPCFRAFPHINQIIKERKNKPLDFVFFCLDGQSNLKRYTELVNKYNLSGKQFCLDKQQTKEFKKLFNIGAIPHQVLFDKDGNMRENGRGNHHIDETIDKWIE